MSGLRFLTIAAVCSAVVSTGAMGAEVDYEAVRVANEKYRDVEVALADGFILAPPGDCVSAAHEGLPAEWGAMGLHYIHPGRLKITATEPRVDGQSTHTDFVNPAILIYEPQEDGTLELMAVENLVFKAAWAAAGNDGPPVIAGRNWDDMEDDPATAGDEAHGFQPHYDQHVWLYRENPSGMLLPFNPAATCAHAKPHG